MAEEEEEERKTDVGNGYLTAPSIPHYSRYSNRLRKRTNISYQERSEKSDSEGSLNETKVQPKYQHKTRSKMWKYFERIVDAPEKCGKCHVCGTIVPADSKKHGTKRLLSHFQKCSKVHGAAYAENQAVAPQDDKTRLSPPPGFKVKPNYDGGEDDVVDFRGLARLPRRQVLLLEEECLENPSLAECEGTSARWRRFVYETVGELLHFMRSTTYGDMADEAKRARLRQLWDEARDPAGPARVSRLEAGVKSGLEAGPYLERERAAVAALEGEMGRLDKDHDTLRCQLATLTMLMIENERGRASLEVQIGAVKDRVKTAEEAFLW